ncbi:MAG TPA: peptide chain release factor 1 [Candidatus Omnitrophota bacterium]|nr:peptide chain release factor 1 [Candidatus Omnitrophota bacterium]
MFEKLAKQKERFDELENLLADPDVIGDKAKYQQVAKEYSDLTPLVAAFKEHEKTVRQIDELKKLLKEKHDREFEELAKEELSELQKNEKQLLEQLKDLVNPKKQGSNKNLIIEIRAGTGGEEASLFAADLYRMYTKFADKKGWKAEHISSSHSDTGGFKEVIFSISGVGAESRLKYESGAHRVQRVPTTEASGRIHTSAVTVAVLFEAEEIEVKIEPSDLKIDIYRSSGPGGQSVNTTDSAVRITHLPTGLVVTCQDERSQLKNRLKAMRVLRARLYDQMKQEQYEKEYRERKLKIGSGDRSEKIRTYNFPDRRVTDHRIGFTSHQLQSILDGDLDGLTDALMAAAEKEQA